MKLRRLLRRRGSRADLARMLRVRQNTISGWLGKEHKVPNRETIEAIREWSSGYIVADDWFQTFRRGVAIEAPPSVIPFVDTPEAKPPRLFFEKTLYLNGYPPIEITNIDHGHQGVVITESTMKVIFGENTLGMSAPLEMLRSGKWMKP
jgi:transcriptional regulator with XRE-family HTH domain